MKSPLRKRLGGTSTMLLGLLVAFLIIIVVRRPSGVMGTRFTKEPRVGFFLKRGGWTSAGRAGDVVRPGDAVQFVYTSEKASYLTILTADAGGHVEVRYADGRQAARAPAGRDVVLPQSALLDDIIGHERVLALFCDRPVDVEPLRRGWQAISGAGDPPIPAGCQVDVTEWETRMP